MNAEERKAFETLNTELTKLNEELTAARSRVDTLTGYLNQLTTAIDPVAKSSFETIGKAVATARETAQGIYASVDKVFPSAS